MVVSVGAANGWTLVPLVRYRCRAGGKQRGASIVRYNSMVTYRCRAGGKLRKAGRQNALIGVAFARLAPSLVKEVNKKETSIPRRSPGWEGPRRPE